MCGFIGIVRAARDSISVSDQAFQRMRDTMIARGPDAAGVLRRDNVLFGHRRLSIIDVENGSQPLLSRCGRYALIYNGELYNDGELRRELGDVPWRTECDTETILEVLSRSWADGLTVLRGMFGLAFYDFQEQRMLLARDPMGIKPVYFAQVGPEIVVGSHLPALLAHPNISLNPDWPTVSSYLTTLRTTLGNRTMFEGVQCLRPGEFLEVDCRSAPQMSTASYWSEPMPASWDAEEAVAAVRDAVIDSVRSHLRSDVSRCSLLSGGLDSSIIATLAGSESGFAEDLMRTWCAGAPDGSGDHDFHHAAIVAQHIGTKHSEVPIGETEFLQHWSHLVSEVGLPISTPNETAIYAVCRDLKQHATVALSGEGADELFAGYGGPLLAGIDGIQRRMAPHEDISPEWTRYLAELANLYGTDDLGDDVQNYLMCTSWAGLNVKPHLLNTEVSEASGHDALLAEELYAQFASGPDDPRERLLRVHRRINLTGLLRRLDTASMLASVEGRTPFADVRIAELAMSLPFDLKLRVPRHEDGGYLSANRAKERGLETKVVLRHAFRRELPKTIVERPKASFPLPFQTWLPKAVETLRSGPIQQVVRQDALDFLSSDPEAHWQMAWPVMNLSRWLSRWWG